MGILFRTVWREVAASATLGAVLFIFVLFLQKAGQLFSILVNSGAKPLAVGYLFLLLLPATLPLTLPLGVLVGTLIGLNRMSSDGEITALRASGVPGRKVAYPVLWFAFIAMALTAYCSLWLTPHAIRETYRVLNKVAAEQLTAEIQPRVFEESFPRMVLYVGDVIPTKPVRWRTVFMADMTRPAERKSGATDRGEGPRITVAAEAIAEPDSAKNQIQLSLLNGAFYEPGKEPQIYYDGNFPKGEQLLESKPPAERRAKEYVAMDTIPLAKELGASVDARIEFHQRFALPIACILLALTGIPLGVSSRKGGRSGAFVITVFFAFLYFMTLISLIGLAREGRLPAEVAVWTPNLLFGIAGIVLFTRLERPGDRDVIGAIGSRARDLGLRLQALVRREPKAGAPASTASTRRLFLLPQVLDGFILGEFFFYLIVLLASFVLLTEIFNFLELLGDVFRNQIPIRKLFVYLFFLTPKLVYDAAPVSVLVAILVTFGILTKNNEITALKACGVSLYRLSLPILIACAVMSAGLFAFDHYVVPEANLIQDALRNEIKGRAVQTYLNPNRKWVFGHGSRIYYYQLFDPNEDILGGVSVFQLNPATFRLTRQIYAERARWEPKLKTWIFQNGWAREFPSGPSSYKPFLNQTATFDELDESPAYFRTEVKTYKQMNYRQLEEYIGEIRQRGFNVIPLEVQYHKKFSVPLFVLIMALLSAPFAFLTGNRGAMTGVGISFGAAIAYFAVNQLFEQLGNVNLLPPAVAAWSPDAIFALTGLYLMTRMRT
ncbi:MAG: LptF/LptG family permease [Bryobacterales bacterium]|nr:LptF/LptG family permease [Bryobacterales bacterium]